MGFPNMEGKTKQEKASAFVRAAPWILLAVGLAFIAPFSASLYEYDHSSSLEEHRFKAVYNVNLTFLVIALLVVVVAISVLCVRHIPSLRRGVTG